MWDERWYQTRGSDTTPIKNEVVARVALVPRLLSGVRSGTGKAGQQDWALESLGIGVHQCGSMVVTFLVIKRVVVKVMIDFCCDRRRLDAFRFRQYL